MVSESSISQRIQRLKLTSTTNEKWFTKTMQKTY